MKIAVLYFLFLVQILTVPISAQAISRASYGENCSKEIRCESRNFLSCSNGQCDCMMPDTMVFDEKEDKCVTLAGERCQYNTVESESTWTEEVPCISNALCQNGICECDPNHYEISNGTCQRKRNYGEECINNDMCNQTKSLMCGGEQTCTCASNRHLSDGTCKLLTGHRCNSEDNQCTDHSSCVQNPIENLLFECKCDTHFYETINNTCEMKGHLGSDCIDNSHCLDTVPSRSPVELQSFLVCVGEKCQCDNRIATEDSNSDRFCGKLVGMVCKNNECLSGSVCSHDNCKCQNDHYIESNLTCQPKRAFGEYCINNEQCRESLTCDLTAKNCACPFGKSFCPVQKRCVISAAHVCRQDKYSNIQGSCVPYAECRRQTIDNSAPWKCTCSYPTKEAALSDGYCYVEEGATCDGDVYYEPRTPKSCLPGLVCTQANCTCLYVEHQVFQEVKEKCFSYIGGPCNGTGDCLDENAECRFEDEVQLCRCKKGFTEAERGCDRAYGEKCVQGRTDPRCDRYGPLKCSYREMCECSGFQTYDKDMLACRGLVGAKCKYSLVDKKRFCVEGAMCRPFRGFEKIFGLCTCKPGWKAQSNRTCVYVPQLEITTEQNKGN